MVTVKKMTDREFLEKNVKVGKNAIGMTEARFTCADGYSYSACEKTSGRDGRTKLKQHLIDWVLKQQDHPIQKVGRQLKKFLAKA